MQITDGRGSGNTDFLGDYKGIAVSGPDVLVVWQDTRRDSGDIYFSRAVGSGRAVARRRAVPAKRLSPTAIAARDRVRRAGRWRGHARARRPDRRPRIRWRARSRRRSGASTWPPRSTSASCTTTATDLKEHRAVVKLLVATRARYDRAKTKAAVTAIRTRLPPTVEDVAPQITRIDHWGTNSNLLADYDAYLKALSDALSGRAHRIPRRRPRPARRGQHADLDRRTQAHQGLAGRSRRIEGRVASSDEQAQASWRVARVNRRAPRRRRSTARRRGGPATRRAAPARRWPPSSRTGS